MFENNTHVRLRLNIEIRSCYCVRYSAGPPVDMKVVHGFYASEIRLSSVQSKHSYGGGGTDVALR